MSGNEPMQLPDFQSVESPCFVVDAPGLRRNAALLADLRRRSGVRIILALKGFAMHPAFPLLEDALDGTTASSLNEALLGSLEFGKELHTYAVAYTDADFPKLQELSSHITFNSLSQWQHFREQALARPELQYGLRINPRYSEVDVELYNPCRPGSRFGMCAEDLQGQDLQGLSGLHMHTLCEQGSDVLERTLEHVERDFAPWLDQMQWFNLGGGHHLTRADYDQERLIRCLDRFRSRWQLQLIMEPGEAVALNAGWLRASVLDLFCSQGHEHAILDVSATAHTPDVLEMPYRPEILGAAAPGERKYSYRLGGVSCLSGDSYGDYSFDQPLQVGDEIVFTDMSIYSMVKTSHFNGVAHPAIALWDPENGGMQVTRRFGYAPYRDRLG